jgi:hypothetical protein
MASKELDPLGDCDRLFFYHGAALMALDPGRPLHRETAEQLWNLLPLIKALARVGRAHEPELRAAYADALQEPMPFGCPAIGLPQEKPPS